MERNAFKSKSVSQVRMYIMMGLGLIFPIILYCAFEISWKNVFMCRENSIADIVVIALVVIALIVEIIKLILYIVDIVKVAAATDKVAMLIVLFFFLPASIFCISPNDIETVCTWQYCIPDSWNFRTSITNNRICVWCIL